MNFMKTLFVTLIVMALSCTPALALNLELGAEAEVQIDKEVSLDKLGVDADYSAQHYDLTFKTKLTDWLTITPKVGILYNQLGYNGTTDIDVDSELGLSAGIEAQADVFEYSECILSLIGSYRYSNSEIDTVNIGGLELDNPIEVDLNIHEYELGAKVSRSLAEYGVPVTPYIGIVYSDLIGDATANLSVVELTEDINASKNIGLRFGIAGQISDNISLCLDGKLIDEKAIAGSVSVKF